MKIGLSNVVTSPLAGEQRPPSAAVLEKNAEAQASATSHRRCDPGEGFRIIDRLCPLTPTLSCKGRGSMLPLSIHWEDMKCRIWLQPAACRVRAASAG